AVKTRGRFNVFVDGVYSFSLDEMQLLESGIKRGQQVSDQALNSLKEESLFGKAYARMLEYIFRRLRSEKELRDYAWRKQWPPELTEQLLARLRQKGYVDDAKFAAAWVRSRQATKPTSRRKLQLELKQKGVDGSIIQVALEDESHDEYAELRRIVQKRHKRYDDEQKFIAYLARQGFSFDAIKTVLSEAEE
ncbi:MAG TPA: RecX family transcriptional regulator, partial [Candidatus Saccharimonadales bacterium]